MYIEVSSIQRKQIKICRKFATRWKCAICDSYSRKQCNQ